MKILISILILLSSLPSLAEDLSERDKMDLAVSRCKHSNSALASAGGGSAIGGSYGALGCFGGPVGCVLGIGAGLILGAGTGVAINAERKTECFDEQMKKFDRVSETVK